MIDEILEKFGLRYEDLNDGEKETLNSWYNAIQQNQLSVEEIRTYVIQMKDAVSLELSVTGISDKQDTLLKARLRNYTLLEAFLTTPEKAKLRMETALSGLKPGVVG